MIRAICRDIFFLGMKSELAEKADISVADDLLETLKSNADRCVGMAANMIGVKKCIIAVCVGKGKYEVMFNPKITKASGEYETTEGCLSLNGERPTKRYRQITVAYQDRLFRNLTKQYEGRTAQIIQHEIDHTNGIII